MKLKDYLRREAPLLIGFVSAMAIVNIIFVVSLREDQYYGDLVYMDVLCLLIFVSSMSYHYFKLAKEYKKLKLLIKQKKRLEETLQQNKGLPEMALMKKVMLYEKEKLGQDIMYYKEKLENMTDYTTQIVHDLKVKLAVCEMVVKRIPLEERETLGYELEQMKFQVGQMLHVARANHYNEDIKAEYFQIQDVLKKAIKENTEFFVNKNIEIQVQVKAYEVLNDQKWVLYILSQILNNSSKYTNVGGKVEIVSEEDERAYSICLRDNGIGIAKEELGRVFDKGYTGSNGRLNTKATGMGLYYAKRMAEVLNMDISVESEQGIYTAFRVFFYKHSDYIRLQEHQEQDTAPPKSVFTMTKMSL